MLEELLRRAAVAAADDERALGARVRERRHVDQVLVVEELVHLGRHEMTVETEQLAEMRGVVHLDRLVRRAELLELACERMKNPHASVRYSVISPGAIVAAGVARRAARLLRHPFRRDGSSGTCVRCGFSAASSARNSRSAFAVLSVARLHT